MSRGLRLALGFLAVSAIAPVPSLHAQYNYPYGVGYNGGGFGGFSGTVGGDVARGMGTFAADAGVYNEETAAANALNANTIGQINQYMYLSQQEANRREALRMARRQGRVNATQATAQTIAQRLRDNPTEADIDSGAALNAILDQLSEPRIFSGSTLRAANAKVDAKMIRDLSFLDATDAITISLGQLTDSKSWPGALRDPAFATERDAYTKAVADALEEDKEGDLSAASIARVRKTIADLYKRVGETIPATRQPDHLQAMNYLKGLSAFSKMLERPNVDQVLAELNKIETTTVGNLLAFMHAYNLRFGSAQSPKQRLANQKVYALLVETREKLIGKTPATNPANTPASPGSAATATGSPTEIFHGIDARHLHGTPAPPTPNPAPATTTPKAAGSPR